MIATLFASLAAFIATNTDDLFINMLLFSEGFENLGISVLSIIAGGLIAVLAKSKTGRSKKRHIKMRSR